MYAFMYVCTFTGLGVVRKPRTETVTVQVHKDGWSIFPHIYVT
jgi:hypothetical protein